jgi:CRP-like cAMP-binding protein
MESRDILKSIPLFAGALSSTQLARLGESSKLTDFPRGAVLVRQGDLGASLFAIAGGKVSVAIHMPGGERKISTLGPGEIVGEMALLTGARRNATVTASTKVAALEVTKAALESVLVDSRDLIERFASMIEQRRAEIDHIHEDDARHRSIGLSRDEFVARMTAFYAG